MKAKKKSPRPTFRLIRGFFTLAMLLVVVGIIGSLYMRSKVVTLLHDRARDSSSVVMGRTYPISKNTNVRRDRIAGRLSRLGYQKIKGTPQYPGQFRSTPEQLSIFLRETQLPTGLAQPAQLIALELDTEGNVTNVQDVKFQEPLQHIWLEPETISLLGNTSARATTPLKLGDFSPHLSSAIISIEDERFYQHFGVDPIAILRAFYINVKSGEILQGGSTITQQLAKNLFFTRERTLKRKLFEAFSALLIETAFTKEQILEFYLNEVFLGQEGRFAIHGFGEASRSLFGKDASKLSLSEAALLAGMIRAPSRYAPRRHLERALTRRNVVLQKMAEIGAITDKAYSQARSEKPRLQTAPRSRRRSPYYVDYVRRVLSSAVRAEAINPLSLQIHTGLDSEFQLCAEKAVSRGLGDLEKSFARLKRASEPVQAALVAVEPASGLIRAWVGGRDYSENQFDRVSQAKRQPGSAFKPFVYLTAIDRDLNSYRVARTTSILEDRPITIPIPGSDNWSPQNYDKKFRGDVTLREALARSLNVPTVNLAMKVGIHNVARTASLFGFGDNLPRVPSLALGAGEVSPLELARAYTAVANGGLLTDLRSIISITVDGDDYPLISTNLQQERVASEAATFVLTNLMQSVVENGTGRVVRRLGYKGPAAGKTGTSNDARDSWFAGFTPQLLAVAWVGYDDNRVLGLTGSQAAAPIWTHFMNCAGEMLPDLEFLPPPDVVYKKIDTASGLLMTPYCPRENEVLELFVQGADPISPCDLHAPRDFFEQRRRERDRFGSSNDTNRRRRSSRGSSVIDSIFKGIDELFGAGR